MALLLSKLSRAVRLASGLLCYYNSNLEAPSIQLNCFDPMSLANCWHCLPFLTRLVIAPTRPIHCRWKPFKRRQRHRRSKMDLRFVSMWMLCVSDRCACSDGVLRGSLFRSLMAHDVHPSAAYLPVLLPPTGADSVVRDGGGRDEL